MIAGGASHPVRRERRRGVDVHAGGTLRRVRVGVRVRVRVGDRVGDWDRDRVGDWDRDRASPCAG